MGSLKMSVDQFYKIVPAGQLTFRRDSICTDEVSRRETETIGFRRGRELLKSG